MKHIHPFPARMAPELAVEAMQGLTQGAKILDPMMGSGTVLRHAAKMGFRAYGFDLDPLAVLVSSVSCKRIDVDRAEALLAALTKRVDGMKLREAVLPWQEESQETSRFVKFWFGKKQANALRKLSFVLKDMAEHGNESVELDLLRVALSRIIVTKDSGASLARDISHSRPHKVRDCSDYDVMKGFQKAAKRILALVAAEQPQTDASVKRGDARKLRACSAREFDLVITSPPYLNAIDYLRGHKLSLVWLGYTIEELREIRSESTGAARGCKIDSEDDLDSICDAMINVNDAPLRLQSVVKRYAGDIHKTVSEIARVLKPHGKVVFVVGNCTVQSTFVSNSKGIAKSAELAGLKLVSSATRELPAALRYLPITATGALGNRLRTEDVLTFIPA